MTASQGSVVVLSGGVGGARLVHGLASLLPADRLAVIVNTGDDFDHWGLRVCPDLDTVAYTLADLAPVERGWGLAEESFQALDAMRRLGGEDWFALGDRDLATHLFRTDALRRGGRLTEVSARIATALGVGVRLLPMSDEECPTTLVTREGVTLPFQQWLVRHRAPAVREVRIPRAPPATPEVLRALEEASLVVLAPSNPFVSVDPILRRPGLLERLVDKPVVLVSPLVGGRAVKGPLAEMFRDLLGVAPGTRALIDHYAGLVRGVVVHEGDGGDSGLPERVTDTLMTTRARSRAVAEVTLELGAALP